MSQQKVEQIPIAESLVTSELLTGWRESIRQCIDVVRTRRIQSNLRWMTRHGRSPKQFQGTLATVVETPEGLRVGMSRYIDGEDGQEAYLTLLLSATGEYCEAVLHQIHTSNEHGEQTSTLTSTKEGTLSLRTVSEFLSTSRLCLERGKDPEE